MGGGRQREGRIAVAGREGGQDEITAQHREVWVRWQVERGAQIVEWLRDDLVPYEGPRRADQHAGMREPESLCRDDAAEVELLGHDEVGLPRLTERKDVRCPVLRDQSGPSLAQEQLFACGDGRQ
jgi:hypothetical protein